MQSRTGQDFAAGILFAIVGVGAIWIGSDYPMGTAQRPGTGVLPYILAWCLVATGGILIIKALLSGDTLVGPWAWRSLIMVTLSVVSFGLFIDELGFALTTIISLTLCAMGTAETRWFEYAAFLVIMLAIGIGTFIWLLGMPIPLGPVKVPTWLPFNFR